MDIGLHAVKPGKWVACQNVCEWAQMLKSKDRRITEQHPTLVAK